MFLSLSLSLSLSRKVLEACVRDELNVTADRVMACLEPLKVIIDNYESLSVTSAVLSSNSAEPTTATLPASSTSFIEVLRIPGDSARGLRKIAVGKTIYIDKSDFREKSEPGYRRLTPEQPVALKYNGLVISLTSVERDQSGNPVALHVNGAVLTPANKPKAFITWVADAPESSGSSASKKQVELRIINHLFLHKNPEDKEAVPNGWMSDVNPNSMVVINNAVVDAGINGAKEGDSFQFERFGFFTIDSDTTSDKIVLNQIVSLKEDAGKN